MLMAALSFYTPNRQWIAPMAKGDIDELRSFSEALGSDWSVAGRLAAIHRAFCIVELAPDGKILHVNSNFLQLMGYTLPEIRGKNHRILCFDDYAESADYAELWRKLHDRQYVDEVVMRRCADNQPVWLQAIYVPVLSPQGHLLRILKVAIDITTTHLLKLHSIATLTALSLSLNIAELAPDGTILYANDNFLALFSYQAEDICGAPHHVLYEPNYACSKAYSELWERLRKGEFHRCLETYRHQNTSPIVVSATYNPVFDALGQITRIVVVVAPTGHS